MKTCQTETISQKDLFQPHFVDIINPNRPLFDWLKSPDWKQLGLTLSAHFSSLGAAVLPTQSYGRVLQLPKLRPLHDGCAYQYMLKKRLKVLIYNP